LAGRGGALERQVRAFDPWPGAFFVIGSERIRVLAADALPCPPATPPGTVLDDRLTIACGDGALRPSGCNGLSAPMETAALCAALRSRPERSCRARYKLTVEYDAPLVGWQRQAIGMSVQEALETALLRFCGRLSRFMVPAAPMQGYTRWRRSRILISPAKTHRTIRSALNHHLRPHAISVLDAAPAPAISTRAVRRSAASTTTAS